MPQSKIFCFNVSCKEGKKSLLQETYVIQQLKAMVHSYDCINYCPFLKFYVLKVALKVIFYLAEVHASKNHQNLFLIRVKYLCKKLEAYVPYICYKIMAELFISCCLTCTASAYLYRSKAVTKSILSSKLFSSFVLRIDFKQLAIVSTS